MELKLSTHVEDNFILVVSGVNSDKSAPVLFCDN